MTSHSQASANSNLRKLLSCLGPFTQSQYREALDEATYLPCGFVDRYTCTAMSSDRGSIFASSPAGQMHCCLPKHRCTRSPVQHYDTICPSGRDTMLHTKSKIGPQGCEGDESATSDPSSKRYRMGHHKPPNGAPLPLRASMHVGIKLQATNRARIALPRCSIWAG